MVPSFIFNLISCSFLVRSIVSFSCSLNLTSNQVCFWSINFAIWVSIQLVALPSLLQCLFHPIFSTTKVMVIKLQYYPYSDCQCRIPSTTNMNSTPLDYVHKFLIRTPYIPSRASILTQNAKRYNLTFKRHTKQYNKKRLEFI